MIVGRNVVCDFCNRVCLSDEFTSIHLEDQDGQPHEFCFHNRNSQDCLAKKLSLLRSQFLAAS